MQQMIASYLFQNKSCPLPGLGTLHLRVLPAEANFGNKQIAAPQQVIQFDNKETDATVLIQYIASATQISVDDATEAIDHFCESIHTKLVSKTKAIVEGIGIFSKNAALETVFKQEEIPSIYFPAITAERVIHPAAVHQILVGDKETTNTKMSAFYNETETITYKWWVWALFIAAVGLTMMLIYFTEARGGFPFGNTIKI